MAFNPLQEKGVPLEKQLRNWSELNQTPYDTHSVHPYTRCRIIAMNGIEVESIIFGHQYHRHTADMDLRRQLAMVRRIEQQQQKAVGALIPGEETTLEVTIGYEQVAVDLTAWVAQSEPNAYAKQCYDFGLLEDFDHLYRYANLLDLTSPRKAAELVGQLTEITPGRPTFMEHRHPFDDVRKPLAKDGDPLSLMHAMTITAAEQQTMNFYMNMANRFIEPVARGLYTEIAEIEEQHVTQYGSLLPPDCTWAEMLVQHEYNECYMYWSFMQNEDDSRVKALWELHLNFEIEHLRQACEIMKKVDGKDPEAMLPKELPEPVKFQSNKEYVRKVLGSQVNLTAKETEFLPMDSLDKNFRYFGYRDAVNGNVPAPTEAIINEHRQREGSDYRLETEGPHPVDWLRQQQAAE
ncbi:MAG: hypothetical protein H7Y60_10735 [Rhodospirillaceae bacterium]|nr:hypothetical protein [Rhodospirillales bacterium]